MTNKINNQNLVIQHLPSKLAAVVFFKLLCVVTSCGNPELNSQNINKEQDSEILAQQSMADGFASSESFESNGAASQEILSFSLDASAVFCPLNFSYNPTTFLCESATEALGPFTEKMISKCVSFGGGSACSRANWEVVFARKLRGIEVCPDGATRQASTGLCIEGEHAFGPFSKAHVEKCKLLDGGVETCESLRWSKELAVDTLPAAEKPEKFTFPFAGAALASYLEAPRSFGSCRNGCARKHAAADLYGEVGRPIYAVGDGTVLDFYAFYLGTYALVVDHGDFIVRYGEITSKLGPGVSVGKRILRGQRIAEVGNLDGLDINMLHFERFSGTRSGSLTNGVAPFYRRSDLVNPTNDLIKWKYPK